VHPPCAGSIYHTCVQLLIRFFLGGLLVLVFSLIGDVLRPKGFAGLFGAAPSIALSTLALTVAEKGNAYAALEARSMMLGAIAFLCYSIVCCLLMAKRHLRAPVTTLGLLPLWGACAFTLLALVR